MKQPLTRWFPVFVLPTLTAFCVAFLVPFGMGVWLSFHRFTTLKNARFVGLDNYVRALTADDDFIRALGFSAVFTVVCLILVNLLAFALALALTRPRRGTTLLRGMFFLPNLIGGIVLGYVFSLLVNGLLGFAGVDITYSATYGFWGLVALNVWQLTGYMMVIYIAGLQNVPGELMEAAAIDGAGRWTTLWRVKIPLQSQAQRLHHQVVVKQLLVPTQGETTPLHTILGIVEGVDNQHHNRGVQKTENEDVVDTRQCFHAITPPTSAL